MIIHDLRCVDCGRVDSDVPTEFDDYGTCGCGGERRVTWEGGRPPGTDVYGVAEFNRGLGCEVTSTREAERVARERGYEPCADRTHGGEYIPEAKERPALRPQHRRSGPSRSAAEFEEVAI